MLQRCVFMSNSTIGLRNSRFRAENGEGMRAREEGGVKLLRPFDSEQGARIRCLVSTALRGTTYHGVGSSTGGFILVKEGTTPQLQICNHDLPITAAALWAPVSSNTYDRELDDEAPLLLATCCRATIVLSHVHPSLTESSVVWRHKLAATGAQPASPSNACFDPITGFLLAVALGREVLVLRVEHGDVLARLRGHGAEVAAVHFDPHKSHILASCAEDGMLKVWDLSQRSCLAQAHVDVSPGDTLSELAIDHTGETWCVCSSGGRVTLFHCHHEERPIATPRSAGSALPPIEGARGHNPEVMTHEAVHLVEAFTITLPRADRVRCVDDDRPEFELRVEDSLSVLGLGFVGTQRGSEAAAGGEACAHIVTSEGVFLLACRSGRIRGLTLPDTVLSHCPFAYAVVGPSVALLACALQPLCLSLPLTALRPQPSPAPIHPPQLDDTPAHETPEAHGPEEEEEEEEGPSLSLFPSPTTPIPSWSPLAAVFQNQTTTPVKKSMAYDHYDKPPGHKKVPALHDRPVVFHARIRSSGYGTPSPSKTHKTTKSSSTSASKAKPSALSSKRYPLDCGPLTKHQAQHDASPRLPPILSLTYFEAAGGGTGGATGGSCIAASTIDGAVHVMRLPIAKHQGEGFALCGHGKSPVRGVCPSHAPGLLLSCSDDGSAKLWAPHVSHTAAALSFTPPSPPPSNPLPAVMHAQFFYLDKFVLLCAGRCAYLYRYTLQLPGRDALLRHPPPSGSAKIVHCFSLPHTQKIVAMDALNAVLSPIIIAAGSDRSLSVLDAGQGKVLRTLHCAHGRAVHSVALPKPSPFASLPPERLDVFATAATDNVVTLWDVRSKLGRVASFREHVNRRERVALSLSPCMRYVAVGSEDRCLYLYDARRGAAAAKTQCHEDVVSCAAFHPLHPQLATAGYDGAVRFFTSHDNQTTQQSPLSQVSQGSQQRLHSKSPSPPQPHRPALVRR